MTDFPRDELSEEAMLRQRLKECIGNIQEWSMRLDESPLVSLEGKKTAFDLTKEMVDRVRVIQMEMEAYYERYSA